MTMNPQSARDDEETTWTTVLGTIHKGMKVIDAEGTCLGKVQRLHGNELRLEGGDFLDVSQIDGVGEEGVLLSPRDDETFGIASSD